jgi:hypothetical protein
MWFRLQPKWHWKSRRLQLLQDIMQQKSSQLTREQALALLRSELESSEWRDWPVWGIFALFAVSAAFFGREFLVVFIGLACSVQVLYTRQQRRRKQILRAFVRLLDEKPLDD